MHVCPPFAATNQPNTCIWCGKKIPRARRFTYDHGVLERWKPGGAALAKPDVPVTSGAELFHSDSCATLFGMAFARAGRRIHHG